MSHREFWTYNVSEKNFRESVKTGEAWCIIDVIYGYPLVAVHKYDVSLVLVPWWVYAARGFLFPHESHEAYARSL